MIQCHDDLQKGKITRITSVKPEIEKSSCSRDRRLQIPLADILAFLGKTFEGMVQPNGIRKETELHL